MTNPQAAVNPSRQAGVDQVNTAYTGLGDQLRQQFLTTGGGKSGKEGAAQLQGALGRAGAIAGVDENAQTQAAALPLTAAQLAEQFLGMNFGQTTTATGTQTGMGTQSGSQSGTNVNGKIGF